MSTGGVLKFLQTSPERTISRGKRCFPERSVGVSRQSPSEFQLRNTLVNQDGYVWKQPATTRLFSHTTYISAVGNSHTNNSFRQQHVKKSAQVKGFNKRRGLLSQFMDNHSWKRGVDKLMGFQRDDAGRTLNNISIEKNKSVINQSRMTRTSKNIKSAFKQTRDSSFYQTIPTKFEEKNMIRTSRNKLYEKELALVSANKKRIKAKTNQHSLINDEQHPNKPRLFSKQMYTTRSQSQNCQTIDNWFGNTARSNNPNPMKLRKSFQANKNKPSRSVVQDGFYKQQIQQFQNKFLKSGLFKKTRSNYWNNLIENGQKLH